MRMMCGKWALRAKGSSWRPMTQGFSGIIRPSSINIVVGMAATRTTITIGGMPRALILMRPVTVLGMVHTPLARWWVMMAIKTRLALLPVRVRSTAKMETTLVGAATRPLASVLSGTWPLGTSIVRTRAPIWPLMPSTTHGAFRVATHNLSKKSPPCKRLVS